MKLLEEEHWKRKVITVQWILPGRRMNWNCQHWRYSWLALSFFPRKVSTLSHCCHFQRIPFFEKFKHPWVFHSFLTLSFAICQVPCAAHNMHCLICFVRQPYEGHAAKQALAVIQSLSHVRLIATPWTAEHQASLSITNSRSLLKLMSIELVMPSSHLILCRPLLLLLSIFPSIRVFSNESALLIRWPKYWSFSFNISPSNEHPGLISFRIDWFDLMSINRL